jgi:hypothetical protein
LKYLYSNYSVKSRKISKIVLTKMLIWQKNGYKQKSPQCGPDCGFTGKIFMDKAEHGVCPYQGEAQGKDLHWQQPAWKLRVQDCRWQK